MSLNRTLSAEVSKLSPVVNSNNRTYPTSKMGRDSQLSVPRSKIGIRKSKCAAIRCIKFERIIESGITDLGKAVFFIKPLSKTIHGVVLVSETEKKFHTSNPENK